MIVSPELHQKVQGVVNNTVSLIEAKYGIKFPAPIVIRYDINSARIGGLALMGRNTIRLNNHFLEKFKDEYINRTVVHEVVHLGVHQVYSVGQGLRTDGHGAEWKRMMRSVGAEPSRCHTFEADAGVGRQKAKFVYKCNLCRRDISVGPKVHNKLQLGAIYHPHCCGRSAKLISTLDTVIQVPKPTFLKDISQPIVDIGGMSKIDKCRQLYRQFAGEGYVRADWIKLFVSKAGCTPAGASTYLNTIKTKG